MEFFWRRASLASRVSSSVPAQGHDGDDDDRTGQDEEDKEDKETKKMMMMRRRRRREEADAEMKQKRKKEVDAVVDWSGRLLVAIFSRLEGFDKILAASPDELKDPFRG